MTPADFHNKVQSFKSPMTSFAYNLTRDYDNAQDLMQETYLRAISNHEKFREGTNLKAWLFTIMKNIFINDYRRKMNRNTILDQSDNSYLLDSNAVSAPNEAEASFVMQDIKAALGSLGPEYRLPFLKHYQGFKYQEIADELRLPLGTVKSRIFFARKQLKDYLESIGFER